MVEANYEFEDNFHNLGTLTPQILRRQEYWTMLSGATGQLYGNRYTWQFLNGWFNRWQAHLDTIGSKQIGYLVALFGSRSWFDLIPDQSHSLVTAGYGNFSSTGTVMSNDYATAARTADGTLAIVYLPTIRTITVDMSKLSAPMTAQWFDPSTGAYIKVAGSPFTTSGTQNFVPPGKNGDGEGDWILLFETAASTVGTGLGRGPRHEQSTQNDKSPRTSIDRLRHSDPRLRIAWPASRDLHFRQGSRLAVIGITRAEERLGTAQAQRIGSGDLLNVLIWTPPTREEPACAGSSRTSIPLKRAPKHMPL
jgi:hypothetical protein